MIRCTMFNMHWKTEWNCKQKEKELKQQLINTQHLAWILVHESRFVWGKEAVIERICEASGF